MATLDELETALRAADAAGNTEDAKRLAQAYSQARASASPAGSQPHAADVPYASGASPYSDADLHPDAMAPERDRTLGERASEVGRGATLALHSLGRGAAGIGDIVAAPLAYGINKGLDAVGVDPSNHQQTGTEIFDRAYAATGLPLPESTAERYVDRVGQGLGGAMSGAGIGQALAGSANPIIAGVGQTMASSPIAQGVGAATSGVAAQAVHEAGLGPAAELGAGLAGGILPAVPSALAGLTRVALRGGEQGRQKVAQAVADFDSAGTTPDVGQATGSKTNQLLGAALSRTPGAAGVIARRSDTQASEIKQGVENLASQLSPKADPGKAGLTIERGITGEGGFVDRFKSKSGELYDKLDTYLPPTTRVDTSNTATALADLVAKIPGAPNLSKFFINGKVASLKGAFDADTTGEQSALNRSDVAGEADRLRNIAGDTNSNASRATAQQNAQIDKENVLRASLGQKPKPYVDAPKVTADDDISSLLSQMQDGRLPYAALKKLRTLVGEEVSSPSLASDVKSSAWKRLYAGISDDLKGAANQAGPEAQQAWSRANGYFRAGQGRIEALDRVVDKAGGPEAVFNAATSGTKDGAFTLRNVMQSLQPDQQKVLSATVVRRLGQATPGTATEQGDFSINSFLTNWNKLSPAAKGVLFDRYGNSFREDVDAISRTAGGFRLAARTGANPSGTAGALANQQAFGGFALAALTGHPLVAGGIAGGAGAANLAARAFTSPTVVKFLAKTTNVPASQWPAVIAGLEQAAQQKNDPVAAEVAQTLRQQLQQPNDDGSKRRNEQQN